MRVIFLKQLKNIAKAGDIKEVSDGYASNFLFPNKLAEKATQENMQKLAAINKKKQEAENTEKKTAGEIKKKIESAEIVISAKAKNGKLFGSINAKAIGEELKKTNFNIDEKSIILPAPIKTAGKYEVKIDLGHGIKALVKIAVEAV